MLTLIIALVLPILVCIKKIPMKVLEIKTLFDKHKDNEKSRSRETTSDKFYEVFSYLLSPRRIGENKNMSLYFFSTKSSSFTFHLIE